MKIVCLQVKLRNSNFSNKKNSSSGGAQEKAKAG
jgi:hypothetical protein